MQLRIDDVNEHINLFAWSAITAPINATSTSLPVPITCSTITSDPYAEFITLPNAIRNLPRQVKNPATDLFGGDCAMQEIIAKQESSAQVSSAAKKFVVDCPEHGHRQARGSRMTIADRLLAETTSETERVRIKRMFFKMTGSCEV
jgi:hypothetical protein